MCTRPVICVDTGHSGSVGQESPRGTVASGFEISETLSGEHV